MSRMSEKVNIRQNASKTVLPTSPQFYLMVMSSTLRKEHFLSLAYCLCKQTIQDTPKILSAKGGIAEALAGYTPKLPLRFWEKYDNFP